MISERAMRQKIDEVLAAAQRRAELRRRLTQALRGAAAAGVMGALAACPIQVEPYDAASAARDAGGDRDVIVMADAMYGVDVPIPDDRRSSQDIYPVYAVDVPMPDVDDGLDVDVRADSMYGVDVPTPDDANDALDVDVRADSMYGVDVPTPDDANEALDVDVQSDVAYGIPC